jgi:phosphoglucomutase
MAIHPLAGKPEQETGWLAARPSGTGDVYKLYSERFNGNEALKRIQEGAQGLIAEVKAKETLWGF